MLRKVKVEAPFYSVNSGIVGLSPAQAKARQHNLKPAKPDSKTGLSTNHEYEVLAPIQFKHGEEFGFSGRVGKDGVLSDPEAEELARMEKAETTEQAVKAAVAAVREEIRQEYAEKLKHVTEQMEAKIRAELEPKIRAEIAAKPTA